MKLRTFRKVGSNMESCLLHAINGKSKVGLTRREIIRNVRAERPEVCELPPRIANVRRVPSINGFHVVGQGQVPELTLNELKVKLGVTGYTALRYIGHVRPLTVRG